MSISLNSQAPDFELVSDSHEPIKLSGLRDSNVLLLFFPGAFTSPCTTELNMVTNDLESYSRYGVQVIGISTDTPFVLAAFKEQLGITFPLLSDHDSLVSMLYSTKYGPGIFPLGLHRVSRRAAFLVDTRGTVRYAEVMEKGGDMPDFDAIKAILPTL